MDYLCYLYDESPEKDLIKLDRIQWAALRTSIGAMRSTHTKSLEAESNVMPLTERRKLLSDKFISKTICNESSLTKYLLESLYNNDSCQENIMKSSFLKTKKCMALVQPPNPLFKYNLFASISKPEILIPNITKSAENTHIITTIINKYLNHFSEFCKIYTDGSKHPDKVGSAIWIPDYNIEGTFQLSQLSSIYTAELKAIIEALEFCKILDHVKYVIISDSKSALMAIKNYPSKDVRPEVLQIKNTIFELKQSGIAVSLLWVPSHSGVDGNEYVDQLAQSVSPACPTLRLETHHKDLFEAFTKDANNNWQTAWTNSDMGRYFYDIKPKINSKPWFYDCLLNRGSITTIKRLRLNHNLTGYHLNRIKIIDSPTCECGSSIDTVDHTVA